MIAAKKRLGDLLIEDGALDHLQLEAALGHQRQWGGKLGEALVHLRLVPEPLVVNALSRRLDCEVARLDELEPGPELDAALQLVPAELARSHLVFPIAATNKTLTLVMADPANVMAADEIALRTLRRVIPRIAGATEVARAIDRFYGAGVDDLPALELEDVLETTGAHTPFDSSPGQYDWFQGTSLRPSGPHVAARPLPAPAPAGPLPLAAALVGDAVQRMAAGAEVPALPSGRLVAAVTAVLLRRGLVTEAELMAELTRPAGAPRG